jgi:DNA repair exonuclease SbcCD ATPase subunit
MKNFVVIALTVVALGLLAPAARAEQYDDLAVKVAELQKGFGNLEALVKNLTYDVQQSQGFGAILKQLSFEMKKAEASINDLSVFERRVNVEVFPTLMNLQTSVAGLITSTQEKFDTLAGRLFTAETTLDQFGVRVSTLEERTRKLLELQDRVVKIEEMIAQMHGQKPGMPSDMLEKLSQSVQALEAQIAQLDQKIEKKSTGGGIGVAGFVFSLLALSAAVVALIFIFDP